MSRRNSNAAIVLIVAVSTALGCSKSSGARSPSETDFPTRITVAARRVSVGIPSSQIRSDVFIGAFTIAKRPVSLGEYQQCVDAGACAAPDLSNEQCATRDAVTATLLESTQPKGDAGGFPARCLPPAAAKQYCAWLGASLPTLGQWTAASRESLTRYPWGFSSPSCEQAADADGNCPGGSSPQLGLHPAGASPVGLEDVLILREEYLRGWGEKIVAACDSVNSCVVYGRSRGAFDGAVFAPSDSVRPDTTFRCVWESEP